MSGGLITGCSSGRTFVNNHATGAFLDAAVTVRAGSNTITFSGDATIRDNQAKKNDGAFTAFYPGGDVHSMSATSYVVKKDFTGSIGYAYYTSVSGASATPVATAGEGWQVGDVIPGFIDAHSHADYAVFTDPHRLHVLRMGVTTEIAGQCGTTISPYRDTMSKDAYKQFTDKMGRVFYSFADQLEAMEKELELGTNLHIFCGHSPVRGNVLGLEDRLATDEEIGQMQLLVYEAVKQGAAGFSTGLSYIPGIYCDTHELVELAKAAGCRISIDMASYNVVESNHAFLHDIVENYVDIVFANETEAKAFTGKEPREALDEIALKCDIAIVKVGKDGSMVKRGEEYHFIQAWPAKPIDATGAGDTYAAGFIYAHSLGMPLKVCGEIGSIIAAKVVEVIGTKIDIPRWKEAKKEIRELIAANS
jgi:hypothetical protein